MLLKTTVEKKAEAGRPYSKFTEIPDVILDTTCGSRGEYAGAVAREPLNPLSASEIGHYHRQ
jgi:hypothetical protein